MSVVNDSVFCFAFSWPHLWVQSWLEWTVLFRLWFSFCWWYLALRICCLTWLSTLELFRSCTGCVQMCKGVKTFRDNPLLPRKGGWVVSSVGWDEQDVRAWPCQHKFSPLWLWRSCVQKDSAFSSINALAHLCGRVPQMQRHGYKEGTSWVSSTH